MSDAAVSDDGPTSVGGGGLAPLAALVAERTGEVGGRPLLVGLAGGVGAGKSTVAAALAEELERAHGLATLVVASDGFLFPNAELARRGLTGRKGFPESYDAVAIEAFLAAARTGEGPLVVPVYDHLFYDVRDEPAVVAPAPVVILEGVNVLWFTDHLDLAVYLDAAEPDIRRWFVSRVQALRREAAGVPGAYLAPFAAADDDEVAAMAEAVWEAINLPNLRQHIEPTSERAHVVVVKGPDHSVADVRVQS